MAAALPRAAYVTAPARCTTHDSAVRALVANGLGRTAESQRCVDCRIPLNARKPTLRCWHCYSALRRTLPINVEGFWSRADRSGGPEACWPWTGTVDRFGYGLYGARKNRRERAHRLAWSLTNGPIPDGLVVCHHCDNPPCCNPAHLFIGTPRDNHDDMVAKGRKVGTLPQAQCGRGHPLTPENTYPLGARRGRSCRQCSLDRDRARRAAQPVPGDQIDPPALSAAGHRNCTGPRQR